MKTIQEVKDLKDKNVLLRTDFDIPVEEANISESFRVEKQKPMVDYLLNRGAGITMVAHISAIKSFELVLGQLEKILDRKIKLAKDIEFKFPDPKSSNLVLLDNIRKWPGEKENSDKFAKQLAEGFDIYVNNAFAVSHRNHASLSAITKFLPSYAGFLLDDETSQLKKAIDSPKEGKLLIVGGAKAETKVPVIKNLIDKADNIIIGGVVANDILKVKGQDIGNSLADDNAEELLSGLNVHDNRIILPEDFTLFENRILDIGPQTIDKFCQVINSAKMIIWNGPVGIFEDERFAVGTNAIAQYVADARGYKIIGGGDTIAAVNKLGLLDKYDFVSTGGGAMLKFLAGERLPGLEVLGYYKP